MVLQKNYTDSVVLYNTGIPRSLFDFYKPCNGCIYKFNMRNNIYDVVGHPSAYPPPPTSGQKSWEGVFMSLLYFPRTMIHLGLPIPAPHHPHSYSDHVEI